MLLLEKWGFFCPVLSSTFIIPHQISLWWKDSPSSCSDKTKFAKQIDRTDLSAKLCIKPRVWSVAYKSCGSPGSWCCHTPRVGCAGLFQHHLSNVVHHVQARQEWLPGAQGHLVSPQVRVPLGRWHQHQEAHQVLRTQVHRLPDDLGPGPAGWWNALSFQNRWGGNCSWAGHSGYTCTGTLQGWKVSSVSSVMCGACLGGYIICLHTLIFEGVL